MKNTVKRVIIAILLLCTTLAFAGFAACGEENVSLENPSDKNKKEQLTNGENDQNSANSDGYDVILSSDGKSVIGLKDSNSTHLTILPSYDGITVTSISDKAFCDCDSLVSVILPDTITSINDWAFGYCSSLVSITIPVGVTNIGKNAFFGCVKLVEVINKSSLEITKGNIEDNGYIGYYALNVKTEGASEIVNKDDYLFYTYDNVNYLLEYVGTEKQLTLPENYNGRKYETYKKAFYNRKSLTSVVVSDGVTSIGYDSFYGCRSLSSVTIGSSVTSIGSYAFYKCESLTSVTFLENFYGWYVKYDNSDTASGINLTLGTESKNANYLKFVYDTYYWYRKA